MNNVPILLSYFPRSLLHLEHQNNNFSYLVSLDTFFFNRCVHLKNAYHFFKTDHYSLLKHTYIWVCLESL